jgi:hypothetical protein
MNKKLKVLIFVILTLFILSLYAFANVVTNVQNIFPQMMNMVGSNTCVPVVISGAANIGSSIPNGQAYVMGNAVIPAVDMSTVIGDVVQAPTVGSLLIAQALVNYVESLFPGSNESTTNFSNVPVINKTNKHVNGVPVGACGSCTSTQTGSLNGIITSGASFAGYATSLAQGQAYWPGGLSPPCTAGISCAPCYCVCEQFQGSAVFFAYVLIGTGYDPTVGSNNSSCLSLGSNQEVTMPSSAQIANAVQVDITNVNGPNAAAQAAVKSALTVYQADIVNPGDVPVTVVTSYTPGNNGAVNVITNSGQNIINAVSNIITNNTNTGNGTGISNVTLTIQNNITAGTNTFANSSALNVPGSVGNPFVYYSNSGTGSGSGNSSVTVNVDITGNIQGAMANALNGQGINSAIIPNETFANINFPNNVNAPAMGVNAMALGVGTNAGNIISAFMVGVNDLPIISFFTDLKDITFSGTSILSIETPAISALGIEAQTVECDFSQWSSIWEFMGNVLLTLVGIKWIMFLFEG